MYVDLEVLTIGPHTLLNPPRIILGLIINITNGSTYVKILQIKRIPFQTLITFASLLQF